MPSDKTTLSRIAQSRQPGWDDGKFSDRHAWQQGSPNIENRLDFVVKRHPLISQKTPNHAWHVSLAISCSAYILVVGCAIEDSGRTAITHRFSANRLLLGCWKIWNSAYLHTFTEVLGSLHERLRRSGLLEALVQDVPSRAKVMLLKVAFFESRIASPQP